MQGLAKELFLKQGYSMPNTVWQMRKKLPTSFNDFLPIGSSGGKGLSVSNCSVTLQSGGEIEEIESISRPGLLLILKCRLWWWVKVVDSDCPPALPSPSFTAGKTESQSSHNKQSNPSF